MITLPRAVVEQALEALEWVIYPQPRQKDAITAIRAALDAPQSEPVGEMVGHHSYGSGERPTIRWADNYWPSIGTKFYTAPAPAIPAVPTPQAALNEAMNDEELNPWKRVLIDVNVTYWSYKKEHDNDPRAALNDLLLQNAHYAADPQVSEIAAKHVNEAIAREIECLRERCAVAKNPLEILDTRANELRGK